MRLPQSLLLALLCTFGLDAFHLFPRSESGPAVVGLKIKRTKLPRSSMLQRRQGVTVPLANEVR